MAIPKLIPNVFTKVRALQQMKKPRCSHLQRYFNSSVNLCCDKKELPSNLANKYETFSEESAPVILDVEEERQKIIDIETFEDEFQGVNLQMGISGVFDIEELVDLLRKEKAEDIVVLKIPSEFKYCSHMAIVNGGSPRHMLAIANFVRQVYKKKVKSSIIPKLEGKESQDWMALDLGNIVLHVFSKSAREIYDLETLWSVGKEYDSLSQNKESSKTLYNFEEILAQLSPKS